MKFVLVSQRETETGHWTLVKPVTYKHFTIKEEYVTWMKRRSTPGIELTAKEKDFDEFIGNYWWYIKPVKASVVDLGLLYLLQLSKDLGYDLIIEPPENVQDHFPRFNYPILRIYDDFMD